jgi:hypothetical protein
MKSLRNAEADNVAARKARAATLGESFAAD